MVLVAEVYRARGSLEEVLRWSHEAAQLFKEEGDAWNEAAARYDITRAHLERNEDADLEQASRALSEARRLVRELGDPDRELVLASVQSSLYFLRGESDEALRVSRESLQAAESSSSKATVAAALHELVHVHLTRGEPREARRRASEARAVYQDQGNWRGEAAVLSAVARSLFAEQRPDDGIEAASEMLALFRRQRDRRGEARLLLDIARLQLNRRMPTRALRAAEAALATFQSLGDAAQVRQATQVVVAAQRMRSMLKEAVSAAKEAMEHYQQYGNPDGLIVSARLVYDARAALDVSGVATGGAPASGGALEAPARGGLVHQPWSCDWLPGSGGARNAEGLRKAGDCYSLAEAGLSLRRAAPPTPPALLPLGPVPAEGGGE